VLLIQDCTKYGSIALSDTPINTLTAPNTVLLGDAIAPNTVTFIYNHYLRLVKGLQQRITRP